MNKILLPDFLGEYAFENVLRQMDERLAPPEEGGGGGSRPLIDGTRVNFVDPYGMVGLIEVGRHLTGRGLSPVLRLSPTGEVAQYLSRMDFYRAAGQVYHLEGVPSPNDRPEGRREDSDVLLEITPIAKTGDIHGIVERVAERAQTILRRHLNYDGRSVHAFIVSLSEVCQNILEHSENTGFVGIQKYFYHRSLGRNVVKIAVMDLGIGMRDSLGSRLSSHFGTAWSDRVAIEQALFHGASRHAEMGRGHGLTEVRKRIYGWNGKISIRSGTAKVSIIPTWDRGRPALSSLVLFPGTQINIVLPSSD